MKIVKIERPAALPNDELVDALKVLMPSVDSGHIQAMAITTLDSEGGAHHYYFGCPDRTDLDERLMLAEMQMGVVDVSIALMRNNNGYSHTFSAGLVVRDDEC